ncbi:hypothetical protein [Natronobacterium texcoconense]|uniref:Uncharacterized protein n=1 Tax=Natronobacterium texcoconense TaxID=1095778 RepID=A0A1H1BWQ3_NATTX|nr:hypothetical protein [Natronobacterium texcoconense]SDQ56321.1 hypothetical protein SAMN04489842_1181 [Natronobacterium texcoconense]
MGVGTSIQRLGHFLEACDEGIGTVHGVEFAGRIDADTGSTADVELTVPTTEKDALTVADVTIGADGRLQFVLETTDPVVPADDELEVEPAAATIDAEGTVTASIRASTSTDGTAADERVDRSSRSETVTASEDEAADGGDREVPPFRDPELLSDVYDSCETFAEMSEAIEMDVTAETVRRYMIDYGIHEPDQYDTDAGGATAGNDDTPTPETGDRDRPESTADESSPVVLTDGLGLPETVTVDGLVEAVSRSNTIYEVERDVGLEREETLELLRRLDLLEFVVGRIRDGYERDVGREDVLERLREASSKQP